MAVKGNLEDFRSLQRCNGGFRYFGMWLRSAA